MHRTWKVQRCGSFYGGTTSNGILGCVIQGMIDEWIVSLLAFTVKYFAIYAHTCCWEAVLRTLENYTGKGFLSLVFAMYFFQSVREKLRF